MDNRKYYTIVSIIEEIETTDKLLNQLNELSSEQGSRALYSEIARKKRNLYQELLAALVQSNLQIKEFEQLYYKIINYLKQENDAQSIPSERKDVIHRAAQFI